MEQIKTVTINGVAVALQAGPRSVWAIVDGTDGKQRRVSYQGTCFCTNVWKNGKTYGAESSCKQLNTKTYSQEAPQLEAALQAYFFEACALEWKAYLEKIQADYDANGYGTVPRPDKLAEVNAYLAAKAAQEAAAAETQAPTKKALATKIAALYVVAYGMVKNGTARLNYQTGNTLDDACKIAGRLDRGVRIAWETYQLESLLEALHYYVAYWLDLAHEAAKAEDGKRQGVDS